MATSDSKKPPDSLFKQHALLTDAATGRKITSQTELVAHCTPEETSFVYKFAQNLTGLTKAAEPCKLILADDIVLPLPEDSNTCELSIRFQDLWLAPAIRVECQWQWPGTNDSLKLSLEFHFNTLHPGLDGIKGDFRLEKDVRHGDMVADEMIFTCSEAACEGFNWIEKYRKRLGSQGMQLYDALISLVKPAEAQKVRLRFRGRFREGSSPLASFLRHLPGGTDWQLPSLSYGDWSTYLPNGTTWYDIRSPDRLINAPVKHLMIPNASFHTFPTLSKAALELAYAAHYSYVEQKLSLELWAKTRHTGIIYPFNEMAVMAVRFKPFEKLSSAKEEKKLHLPDGIFSEMTWYDPKTGRSGKFGGKLVTAPIRLPDNHGVFVITTHSAKALEDLFVPPECECSRWLDVRFKPHINNFTYSGQMNTAKRIISADIARWHPVILNQCYSGLQRVDLVTGRVNDPEVTQLEGPFQEEFERMLKSRDWNPEQIQALKSIRNAPGGIVMISGPAGTGKTEVAQAISELLYQTECHVIALAPQNANCANWMRKLHKGHTKINALRIFPASTEIELKNVDESRAKFAQPGHVGRASTNLIDFDILIAELDAKQKYTGRDFGLQAKVFAAALRGKSKLRGHLRDTGGAPTGSPVDLWGVLRDCIEKSKAGKFNWKDESAVRAYNQSYKACKEHYIAHRRYVVTTTGNVRCSEVVEFWAREVYKTKCKGIVIILDEACKDKEIDTLAMMLSEEHLNKIRGIIMLGDERQLEPTNTSSKAKAVFSAFPERESISLFARLKGQGFPCTELKEQHRMNEHISKFIFANFYPAGMRDAPEMRLPLGEDEPGLQGCLLQFIRDTKEDPELAVNDGALRTAYVQIKGTRIKDEADRSFVVREHIEVFYNGVFWYLHEYYKEALAENVLVIAAYGEALRLWKEASAFIQRQYKLGDKALPSLSFVPECATIDSSQGREANVVFLDCSVQNPNVLGFVDDDKRMNVACSRAKKVFWILGGNCDRRYNLRSKKPAYVRYYDYLKERGRVLQIDNSLIPEARGSAWIDRLKKKEVDLAVRYNKEAVPVKDSAVEVGDRDEESSPSAIWCITEGAAPLSV